jgi:hypothetical protein
MSEFERRKQAVTKALEGLQMYARIDQLKLLTTILCIGNL